MKREDETKLSVGKILKTHGLNCSGDGVCGDQYGPPLGKKKEGTKKVASPETRHA